MRFTIRELVLVTVIVALGVGWWLESRERRNFQVRCQYLAVHLLMGPEARRTAYNELMRIQGQRSGVEHD
jgi:hypothetical protein